MKNHKALLPLITFFLLQNLVIKAQLEADFNMDKNVGCSNTVLTVHFDNLSNCPDGCDNKWYFGDGVSSTDPEPVHNYNVAGVYTVSLVVTHGVEKDSTWKTVTIYNPPTANFTANDQNGCVPFDVQFTDNSVPSGGAINKWEWDFGMGSIINAQSPPIQRYNTAGKYNVFLRVTDVHGCISSTVEEEYIDVVNPVMANFGISPTSSCTAPATFVFADSSTGGGTLSYSWDFGDGTSSTLKNPPPHTYNNFTNYSVTLTTTSNYGCSSSKTKTAYISNVTASGNLSQSGNPLQSGAIVCAGNEAPLVNFTSTSQGTGTIKWLFGDGVSSMGTSVTHRYTTTLPSVTVSLIAAPGTTCADTVKWQLTLERPLADFSLSPVSSCFTSVPVTFTNNSSNYVSCTWTFPDGQQDFTTNPTHTVKLPSSADPYVDNPLTTTLKVVSTNGCTSTANKVITIRRPRAMFTASIDSGCFPLPVNFNDNSISQQTITSRRWIFDDGTEYNSGAVLTSSHTYLSDGDFYPHLIITNSSGCSDTSDNIHIRAGKKLLPDFTTDKNNVCPNEIIQFTNTTPESNLIDKWIYLYGGDQINMDSSNPNLSWKIAPAIGYRDIGLRVSYNGCLSDTLKENVYYNNGPISDFTFSFNCNTPLDYTFQKTSVGDDSFEWKIESLTDNSHPTLNYPFSDEGNYLVELISNKGSCHDTTRETIPVRIADAVISVDSLLCALDPVYISGKGSFSIPTTNPGSYYSWHLCDEVIVSDEDSISYTFIERGSQIIKLVTRFDNGCKDSTTRTVRVFKPYSDFTANPLSGCKGPTGLSVTFDDNSAPDGNALEWWHWYFKPGDEIISSTPTGVFSHTFGTKGIYPVYLEVRDEFGCTNKDIVNISVGDPNAQFLADKNGACYGEEVNFTTLLQAVDSVTWNFGDGNISHSTARPVSHIYTSEGSFTPSLVMYSYGCANSYTLPNSIQVQKANAFFTASDTAWNCYPKLINFTHNPGSQIIESGIWDLDYGNAVIDYTNTSSIYYPRPGTYSPSLIVSTSFHCKDTFTRDIVITGPVGTFTTSNKELCKGDNITLTLVSTQDAVDYEWNFGDGTAIEESIPVVSHTYTDTGTFYPRLILIGDPLRLCTPDIKDTIKVFSVAADFDIPDNGLCDSSIIVLTNTSVGYNTHTWNFNNNFTSSDLDLQLQLEEGDYFAELLVEDTHGCTDTVNKTFTIHPLPVIQIKGDTVLCQGDVISLWATGGDEILWTPSTDLSSVSSYNPQANPDSSIRYTASIIENIFGCENSDSIYILVQLPPDFDIAVIPEVENEPFGDSLVIGKTLRMTVDSLGDFNYLWSPDYMISCINCASPVIQPMESTLYSLVVADTNHCFTENYTVNVPIKKSFIIALPSAFKPAGDSEENRIVKVRGHGIKTLIEFSIYNRWGNKIFYTDDINQGWDGYYNGKLQGIDSYAYVVVAEMWDGTTQTVKGTISLLR